MRKYFIGVDLGQVQDYTAVCVVQKVADDPRAAIEIWGAPDVVNRTADVFTVGFLRRFPLGTPYPGVVREVRRIRAQPPLDGSADLVVDATGVGRAVVDLFEESGLSPIAVTITAGYEASSEGRHWVVPKKDLVAVLAVLLDTGRLKIPATLPDSNTLKEELMDFRVRKTPSANETFSAREGAHDDMVIALALACWYGVQHKPVECW